MLYLKPIIYSIVLNGRALNVFQASPRLSHDEGSPFQQRALAHKVDPLIRRKLIKELFQTLSYPELM